MKLNTISKGKVYSLDRIMYDVWNVDEIIHHVKCKSVRFSLSIINPLPRLVKTNSLPF